MNYERNKKYFEQNLPVWPTITAFAAIALGAFIFIFMGFSRFGGGYIFIPLGLVLMLAGVIGFVILSTIKLKDSEIDDSVPSLEESFKNDFNSRFTVTDAAKLRYQHTYGDRMNHAPVKFEPVWFSTFFFDGSRVMHKIGNDGKSRSSIYSLSAFALKPDSICLGGREVSFVSPEAPAPDFFKEVSYSSIGNCELVIPESSCYDGKTQYRHLRITGTDGSIIAEFPILADASADDDVSDIMTRVRRSHEKE